MDTEWRNRWVEYHYLFCSIVTFTRHCSRKEEKVCAHTLYRINRWNLSCTALQAGTYHADRFWILTMGR